MAPRERGILEVMKTFATLIAALLVTLLGVACTPTIYVYTDAPDENANVIRDAGQHIGVRTKIANSPKGAITVEFRPEEEGVCGQALEKLLEAESLRDVLTNGVVDCEPVAWSCPKSSKFLSHEFAHILNLSHVKLDEDEGDTATARKLWGDDLTKDNLMRPAPTGTEVTKRQRLIVQASAVLMNEVCGARDTTAKDPEPEPEEPPVEPPLVEEAPAEEAPAEEAPVEAPPAEEPPAEEPPPNSDANPA